MKENRFLLPTIILSLAILLSVLLFSGTWKKVRSTDQTINVTGSAKKLIVSDLAVIRGNLNAEAATAKEAYQKLQSQKPILLAYLAKQGFNEKDIDFKTTNSYPNYYYNNNGMQTGIRSYTINQMIEFQSKDVEKMKKLSIDITSLVEQGVEFAVNPPEYYYTKISDIKIDVQAEAAKDAMIRGRRIAEATGRTLGTLKSARMGVLQITPENSNITSDYGVNDVSSIRKEITAVVNANFEIE
ncbi:SIMPL domain-containing protein [Pseudopedobacter sp.]|uniref:SIMPL domain-containing protein n=1 Tax=Pseudopedobacter sp. TaxID=1936787 RepID=UPI00333EDDB1